MVALLDVLVSPAHDLSLARALKSPLFGVPDDDLVELALRHASCVNPAARRQPGLICCKRRALAAPALRGLGAMIQYKGWVDAAAP